MDALADTWPLCGLTIRTLRLARENDLTALAAAARVIGSPGEPQLHLPWMYAPTPDMERQLLQRYWRALAQRR